MSDKLQFVEQARTAYWSRIRLCEGKRNQWQADVGLTLETSILLTIIALFVSYAPRFNTIPLQMVFRLSPT
ncbi:MAG TPA: hypothetical protein DHU55_10850 [Blastocatellia bacterium]|jgi:hypothetical protein|nr:hypothetical protein [Blastocatellia bacterium]HCX30251.1 hypothetical protein [Blastocatellia bacterium]